MRFALCALLSLITLCGFTQDSYLLAGTYNQPSDTAGVYWFRFNSTTGDATPVTSAPSSSPSYFALDKSATHLYVVNELHDGKGTVGAFSLNKKNKSLKFLGSQLTQGDDPCFVSLDASGKWVAVANYSGGSLSIFPLTKSGSPGPAAQTIVHEGKGIDTGRQEKAHVHQTIFSPDGHYLVVVDLGVDKIFSYPFDATATKPLGTAIETNVKAGVGPRHLTFTKDGRRAYLICEMGGDVLAFDYHDGRFDSLQTISSHPSDFTGEKGSAAIRLSPDEKFLYASNRGTSNTIAIFSVDAATGKLTSLGFQNTGGEHPRDFTIDRSGNFLLVGNMNSGYISIFKRDQQTGMLAETGKTIKIPKPTNVLFTSLR